MSNKYIFDDEKLKNIINDYVKNGLPVYKIGKKNNVDGSVIKRLLNENNVEIINESPFSLSYWIKRGFNEDESLKKINGFKPCIIDYWLNKGFSKEESKLKVELHLMNTERSFIEKYGEENGKIKYQESRKINSKGNSKRSVEYWIKRGFNKEESKLKVSESQNMFSLKKCIEKYGNDEGIKIFNERQNKWTNSLNKNGNLKIGYSKISQIVFYNLLEYYEITDKEHIKFATHNKEFRLNKDNGGIWLYDFTDLKNKKIIEYNGDMYHANPKKYSSTDTPHPFNKNITAQEMWDNDKKKIQVAERNGFEVLTIWDSEYRWGKKNNILEKCLKFLKNE